MSNIYVLDYKPYEPKPKSRSLGMCIIAIGDMLLHCKLCVYTGGGGRKPYLLLPCVTVKGKKYKVLQWKNKEISDKFQVECLRQLADKWGV